MSSAQVGMVDLEKELSCSICVEVLHQPLTLLDCLHTFCGACLKEWFSWQRSNATASHPYTCPSCRAPVRDTRPNATVTTLLDMYLTAHPDKQKTLEERKEAEDIYKPGDNVIPPVRPRQESDSEDERMLEQAREISLQDTDPDRARRRTERAERNQRRRRQHDHAVGRSAPIGRPLEHQSSLRSLLSASDIDSNDMEEEIMRQIMSEGLLDGINLEDLTRAQEEELTERIAQLFRDRQRNRSAGSQSQSRHDRSPQPATNTTSSRHHQRPDSSHQRPQNDRAPLSRPHLMADESPRHRHRSSSQTSQRSNHSNGRGEVTLPLPTNITPASRSSTDLTDGSRGHGSERIRRVSREDRIVTDPEQYAGTTRHSRPRTTSVDIPASQHPTTSAQDSERTFQGVRHPPHSSTAGRLPLLRSRNGPSNSSSPVLVTTSALRPENNPSLRPQTASTLTTQSIPPPGVTAIPRIPLPLISCSCCNQSNIATDLHYNCSTCDSGNFNLCLACYRAGRGCQHWFGFGYAADVKFRRTTSPADPNTQQPHVLSARRYRVDKSRSNGNNTSQRLEQGLFCERCFAFADDCYWHCDFCLDGAWGFCNSCVQHGNHCTHPLESVAHKLTRRNNVSQSSGNEPMYLVGNNELYPAPLSPSTIASTKDKSSLPHVPNPADFTSINVGSSCDICHRPIPHSHARFHCYHCNDGDYDICNSCYHNLCATGKVRVEDGVQGWRRCLRGHRMAVTGFEDREGGQRRTVVREIIGGKALKEDAKAQLPSQRDSNSQDREHWRWKESDGTSATHPSTHARLNSQIHDHGQRQYLLPPDGGVGLHVQALWSYFPDPNAKDELSFPKHAQITEAEDINGDWFWGIYAGSKGLFPGNYGRILNS